MSIVPKFVTRRFITDAITQIAAILVVAIFLIPIFWMVTSSFKVPKDILVMPPKWIFTPTLDNYLAVFFGKETIAGTTFPKVEGFGHSLFNSIIIGVGSTFIAMLIGLPVAYAMARFKFASKNVLAFFILSIRMAPEIAVLIPFYILFSKFYLLDTYPALLIIYVTFNVSFVVWMMRGFFRDVPSELEDSARVDGCSRYGAFFRITLPLAAPGMVATAIFVLLLAWNEFLFALVLTGNVTKTAPVAIYGFVSFHEIIWGSLFAAGTMITLPVLIFTLLVQRNLVRGLTMGAIK